VRFKVFPSTFDGESLLVEQPLDLENKSHVLAPVNTVACSGLLGTKAAELCLPETQDVRLHPGQLRNFPDAKAELIRDFRFDHWVDCQIFHLESSQTATHFIRVSTLLRINS